MSDAQNGFGKFVPGFDFLQNLAKGAAQGMPQMPSLSNWVAPTLNVEELDKRIGELKAVHFWLDQNSKALAATIQALEVQKMTLATLKGMNVSMGELANAMKLKPFEASTAGAGGEPAAAAPAVEPVTEPAGTPRSTKGKKPAGAKASPPGVVDPLQWWGSLTQQFQQIAADAMKDAARNTAVDSARNMAGGMAKEAMKTASGMMRSAAPRSGKAAPAATKKAARKRPAARRKPAS